MIIKLTIAPHHREKIIQRFWDQRCVSL